MRKYTYRLEGKSFAFEVTFKAKNIEEADDKMDAIINGDVWKYDIVERKSQLTKKEKDICKNEVRVSVWSALP